MKKIFNNGELSRSPIVVGLSILLTSILVILMLLAAHINMDTSSSKASEGVDDVCTTDSMTTIGMTSTTSSTTSSTTTKLTTTTTATTTQTTTAEITTQKIVSESIQVTELAPEPPVEEPQPEPQIEPQTEPYVAPEPQTEPQPEPVQASTLPITEYERVLLCNVVANEAGSNWISIWDKACVVAVVMNRVNSASYPNTIEGVLTQPYQFSGYWASSYYYSTVTDACIEAVNYYFAHSEEFPYYLSFWGDGRQNHFR